MNSKTINISGKDKKQYKISAERYLEDATEIFHKKTDLKKYVVKDGEFIALNKEILFLIQKSSLIPTISTIRKFASKIPKVIVDIGAIKFIIKGADVMRPGITQIGKDVVEGKLVKIIEEKNGAILSIGRSLYDQVDMEPLETGRVIKNLHHINDIWWRMSL